MIYLTIDTCSWKNLILNDRVNPQLEAIAYWTSHNHVKFIITDILIEEWKKHRKIELETKSQSIKTKKKHFEEIVKQNNVQIPDDFDIDTSFISQQIELINTIILDENYKVEVSDNVKKIIPDKIIKRNAPFHNKIESVQDAYIYFAAVEYCHINSIKELVFISDNTKEFGKPIAKDKGSDCEIHSELLTDFPKVKVTYWGKAERAIHELQAKLPTVPPKTEKNVDFDLFKTDKFYKIKHDGLHMLDYLYQLFSKIYEEISFLPLHILQDIPPFKLDNEAYTFYDSFNLTTNNQELFTFFQIIKGNTKDNQMDCSNLTYFKDVENPELKAEVILNKLTHNLVFNISLNQMDTRNAHVNIWHHKYKKEETLVSTFSDFEFQKTFAKLDEPTNSIYEKFQLAYVHYQLGNYLKAANLYKEISVEAKENHKYVIHFLSKYNLSKLRILIRNNYYGKNNQKILVEELEKINIKEIAMNFPKNGQKNLIHWIESGKYLSNTFSNIHKICDEIIEHYHLQARGGGSSNNPIWKLVSAFAVLDAFLNSNGIIQDTFDEYNQLFQKVMEGLFASHAIITNSSQKLAHLDDYWLPKIIYYGKKDTILKYFNRYKLKEIKYSKEAGNFIELAKNILNNQEETRNNFQKYCEPDNHVFWNKYNNIFENIFVLAALMDLDNSTLNELTSLLIASFPKEIGRIRYTISAIDSFIEAKGVKIDKNLLEKLFMLHFLNPEMDERDLMPTILQQIANQGGVINISQKDIDHFIEKCIAEEQSYITPKVLRKLVKMNKVVNQENQRKIRTKIEKLLTSNFNIEVFSYAAIMDVIPFNEVYFNNYLEYFSKPISKTTTFRSFNSEKEEDEYENHYISNFINLCFKFELSFHNYKFDEIKKYHSYYEWLLNMEFFDYSKFNIEWVLNFKTKYYFKAMSKSEKLKTFLVKYLKNNEHARIERVLLQITYFVED